MKISTKKLTKIPLYLARVLDSDNNQIKLEQLRVKEYSKKITSLRGTRIAIIPWSAGLDSTASLLMALESGNRVITVNFNYGQQYWNKERETINKIRQMIFKRYPQALSLWLQHKEVDISWLDKALKKEFPGEWQHIFPMRNFTILMEVMKVIPINNYKYREIWFSCVQGEIPFSGGDKSIVFLTEVARIFSLNKFLLVLPLIGLNKTDIVKWALNKSYRFEIIKETISCFSGKGEKHCGSCLACFNRLVGYYSAAVVKNCGFIPNYNLLKPFIDKYKSAFKKENYYSPSRKNDIFNLIYFLENKNL